MKLDYILVQALELFKKQNSERQISIELSSQYFLSSGSYISKDEAENIINLLQFKICSFQEICDKYKSPEIFLKANTLFQEMFDKNLVEDNGIIELLKRLQTTYELRCLCENRSLIKYILRNFLIDQEVRIAFDSIVQAKKFFQEEGICDFFGAVQYYATHDSFGALNDAFIDRELLKLNELNKYIYHFNLTKDQKLELSELIKDSEMSKNKLIQIVDSNLESNYDFDSLLSYLKKNEKKNILNI